METISKRKKKKKEREKKSESRFFSPQLNYKFKLKLRPNCCPIKPSGPWWECKAFWENSRCPHVTELPRQLVNLHNFYTHISPSICVCMHVYVCVYILAMGLDPSELRQCFASCWAWEKDGTPFHSCLGRGLGCWGPLYPLYTHPPFPLVRLPPLLLPSHSGSGLLAFKSRTPFPALHKYISLFKP